MDSPELWQEQCLDFVEAASEGSLPEMQGIWAQVVPENRALVLNGGFERTDEGDLEYSPQGSTALHMAAVNGQAEVIQWLLNQENLDVNSPNESQNTPLHWAALQGNAQILKLLIDHGANPNLENVFGHKAYQESYLQGNAETSDFLGSQTMAGTGDTD